MTIETRYIFGEETTPRQIIDDLETRSVVEVGRSTTVVVENPGVHMMIVGQNTWQEPGLDGNPWRHAGEEGYQQLFPGSDRFWYDPLSGEIAVYQLRRRLVDEPLTSDDDLIFYQRNRFKSRERLSLRWSRFVHIERIMRRYSHVATTHSPTGDTTQRIESVYDTSTRALQEYTAQQVDKEIQPMFLERIVRELAQAGLSDAKLANLVEIAKQLIAGASLDSLNRFNPLISQTRYKSAIRKEKEEIRILQNVYYSYAKLSETLPFERLLERYYIEQCRRALLGIFELGFKDGVYTVSGHNRTIKDLRRLERVLPVISEFLDFETIKVSPYRNYAAAARLLLLSEERDPTENVNNPEMVKSLVGDTFYEFATDRFPKSVQDDVKLALTDKTAEQGKLIIAGALAAQLLHEALIVGDLNLLSDTDTEKIDSKFITVLKSPNIVQHKFYDQPADAWLWQMRIPPKR